jgi:DNA ligase-associated metallophosphoesterase
MTAPVLHIIHNNHFWLSPQRCVFWEEEQALILSDLHFGKTGHFRKHGIAVPQNVFTEDMQRLVEQIAYFKPKQVIAVGDLFHSKANKEMDLFVKWRNDFPEIDFILVRGNHDILDMGWYEKTGIQVMEGKYNIGRFSFLHDPAENKLDNSSENFIFFGHLHPGVYISGLGKQGLSFPCFHFTKTQAILPAFSKFSGFVIMRRKKTDTVFAIVGDKIIHL